MTYFQVACKQVLRRELDPAEGLSDLTMMWRKDMRKEVRVLFYTNLLRMIVIAFMIAFGALAKATWFCVLSY